MTFDIALAAYLVALITPGADDRIGRTCVYGRMLSAMPGRRFVRIVATDSSGTRSALAFVEKSNGNIWAPDGWKGPALNFTRGNIYRAIGAAAPAVAS